MADGIGISVGTDATVASDEIAGQHYQRIKITKGGDGSNDGDISDLNPLPVSGPLTDAELRADAVPVSGPLTDAELRANPVPVSGPVTDAQMRSTPLPVQMVTGTPSSAENIYVASVMASAAGADKNHLSLYNADATLKVDILHVYVTKSGTAAVTGLIRAHWLFRFTTLHTGGSAVTPIMLDTGTMDALDADITVRAASTATGAEAIPLGAVGVGEEETAANGGRLDLFNYKDCGYPIVLNQNQGVVVRQDSTAGTGLVSVVIVFKVR